MPDLTIDQIESNRRKLEDEIRQRQELLRAYELVEKHINSTSGSEPRERTRHLVMRAGGGEYRSTGGNMTATVGYGRITQLVKNAIKGNHGGFTIRDIHHQVQGVAPEMSVESVTTAINRLTGHEIRVKKKGKGRRPNIYEIIPR